MTVSLAAGVAASGLAGGGLIGQLLAFVSESIVVNFAFFCVATALIYRYVPTRRPSWHAVGPPAFIVGVFGALLTQLFAVLAPRLVGSLQVYGAIVAVLATMIWLSFISQGLLMGAAWVRSRVHAEATVDGQAGEAGGPTEPRSAPPPGPA